MREVFVLGAGASKAHGAPLTNEILEWALTKASGVDRSRLEVVKEFLEDVFGFRVTARTNWETCPDLPEVMSVVDMALDRGEKLARDYDTVRLRSVRENLEYAIFKALDFGLSHANPERKQTDATFRLANHLDAKTSTVISFNYDILMDVQLMHRGRELDSHSTEQLPGREELPIDYGVEFLRARPAGDDVYTLLKLHGSFNWFWDPETGDLIYGGETKAIKEVYGGRAARRGWKPILVTPTHLKDLRNYHLALLWRKAEQALREADKITFIGYSMPGDDIHIKYLFKRALATRRGAPTKIVVVDWVDPAKRKRGQRTAVQTNYERFFGTRAVKYHPEGFEEYVHQHLGSPRRRASSLRASTKRARAKRAHR